MYGTRRTLWLKPRPTGKLLRRKKLTIELNSMAFLELVPRRPP